MTLGGLHEKNGMQNQLAACSVVKLLHNCEEAIYVYTMGKVSCLLDSQKY